MDTGLKGKNVLITGASRNMGKLAAIQFAQEGANLAICTSSKMRELNAVADELRAFGVKVVAMQCDVAEREAVASFVREAQRQLGSIDVAINNAVHRAEGAFLDESDEVWLRNIAVNLTGPRNVCRAVLPGMIERNWGRIINFSGIAPYVGTGPAKACVKLGIVGFTRGLAREFGPHNITANCIGPGTFDVERDAFQKEKPLKPEQPIRRLGRPEDCTSLMLYLASRDAGFITGQCYLVNGGMYFQ